MRQELYLIRHGESEMNVATHLIGGRSNHTPLTEKGIKQAKLLGKYFLEENIFPNRVFVSPAVRTLQTCQYTLDVLNLDIEPVIVEEIQELDQGSYAGKQRTSVYTPEVVEKIKLQGKNFKLPGGESLNDVSFRMSKWLQTVTLDSSDDVERTFVFGHGLAIRALIASIYGWSHKQILETNTPNTSLTLLVCDGQEWEMKFIGKTPHLE